MNKSIKLVGVGGQGTILAAKVLSTTLLRAGYDVKMSEIHGMSQRGGSVSSEIRYGETVYSPVIEKGHADILVAFEQMEAARYMDYLSKDGLLIVNDYKVDSMITLSGKTPYPKGILDVITKQVESHVIDAHTIAEELGNARTMNIIMLGALSTILDDKHLDFKTSILEHVKPKYHDLNLEAFDRGLQYMGDTTS